VEREKKGLISLLNRGADVMAQSQSSGALHFAVGSRQEKVIARGGNIEETLYSFFQVRKSTPQVMSLLE
jgi:hypothetical protein